MRALWALGAAGALALHPLHTTLTRLDYSAADGTVAVSVRPFADDFRVAVGSNASDSAAFAYVGKALALTDPAGRILPLSWCGLSRTGDLVWLCLRARAPGGLAGVRVQARMLLDHYADQINIVEASYDGRRVSLLFSRGDPPKPLP